LAPTRGLNIMQNFADGLDSRANRIVMSLVGCLGFIVVIDVSKTCPYLKIR
jgi:hypothetical protein